MTHFISNKLYFQMILVLFQLKPISTRQYSNTNSNDINTHDNAYSAVVASDL